MTPHSNKHPTFIIRLRPQPGVDAVRVLRQALKVLLRRFGLKAIEVKEEPRRPSATRSGKQEGEP